MDTASLESVCRRIVEVAEQGGFSDQPDEGGWTAEMVLAHMAATTDEVLGAARSVLAHEHGGVDNANALDEDRLRGAGPWPALIDRFHTSSRQLIDVASQLTEGLEDTEVDIHLVDGGQVVIDGPMPIGRFIGIHADMHLPGHLSQLEQLRPGSQPS
jgi:hypothetical protein